MAKLTKKELAWIKKVQKALDECPSERIGFYTLGEDTLHLYDKGNKEAMSGYVESSLPSLHAGFVEVLCSSEADLGHFFRLPSTIEMG